MERVPEPELMEDDAQARAYAEADFAEPHQYFVTLFQERFFQAHPRKVLDLGCGPGDVSRRFAVAYPDCIVTGIDGSPAMLKYGRQHNLKQNLSQRVELCLGYLPGADLKNAVFDTIISNSLLHHLPDPSTLWRSIRRFGRPGAAVFVMDLLRPQSRQRARDLVEIHCGAEPEILKHDFYVSLLAAYRPSEVRAQLESAGLDSVVIEVASDRHLIVYGVLV